MDPKPLPPLTDDEVTTIAREIVTRVSLLAGMDDPDWQSAMSLLLSGLKGDIPPNVGAVVVPVEGSRWLNGRVPFPVLSARFVPSESVPALQAALDAMYAVLYPGSET
jgi:hypothetical protein